MRRTDLHATCFAVRRGALCEAQWNRPADLVIASVYLPKQSGQRWLRDIKAAHPGTPLIAISGQFRSGLSAAGATAEVLGCNRSLRNHWSAPIFLRRCAV